MTLLAIYIVFVAIGQTGNIELNILGNDDDDASNSSLSVELWLNTQLVTTKTSDDCLFFENIPGDVYRIVITSAGEELLTYNNVLVEENSTTYLDINLPVAEIINDSVPEEFPAYIEFVLPFRFSFPVLEDSNYPIKREIAFGYEYNIVMPVAKHFAIINTVGTGFYFYRVKDNMDVTPALNDKEGFFKWTLSEGLLFRVSSENLKTAPVFGWYLDLGAVYHFPLLFTYKYKLDHTRTATNKIHKYTDVSLMAKFGYAPFGLFVEYNPFSYVKDPYPQMPKLRFGVSIQFPMN